MERWTDPALPSETAYESRVALESLIIALAYSSSIMARFLRKTEAS